MPGRLAQAAEPIALILVDDEKMIADFVERANVPPCQRGALLRNGGALFEKNLEPQPLPLANPPSRRRQSDFKRAETPEHRGQAGKIAHDPVRFYVGGSVPDGPAEGRSYIPHEPANLVLRLRLESRSRTRMFYDKWAKSTEEGKRQ